MGFEPATVHLARIDSQDHTYRITTDSDIGHLQASVAAVGLINPPILARARGGYVIVSGFRRVAACRCLGWRETPASILGEHLDEDVRVRLAISDNCCQRPLNLLERARAAAMLTRLGWQAARLAQEASALGIAENAGMLDKLLALSRMPETVQEGVAQGILPLPVALELDTLGAPTASCLAALFGQLRPSLNRQREIIGLLKEIGRREETTITQLLQAVAEEGMSGGPAGDRNQETRRLLSWLRQRRFPRISRAEAGFARLMQQVRLGPRAALRPPEHFEGRTFTLHLPFDDLAELRQHRDALNALVDEPSLARLLENRFEVD